MKRSESKNTKRRNTKGEEGAQTVKKSNWRRKILRLKRSPTSIQKDFLYRKVN